MSRAWIPVLSLTTLLILSFSAAAPATDAARMGAALEDREGLLRDLEDREAAISARSPARVSEEVRRRAAELGVSAPVEALTELLYRKAHLELAVDRCALDLERATGCGGLAQLLSGVEARFEELTGFTADDFRRGARRPAVRAVELVGPQDRTASLILGGSFRTDPQHCVCSATISSRDRWIGQHWALECNGHAGHGVCSSDLDWAHSPGTGAMTGTIYLHHVSGTRVRDCPDDHRTCFKGPVPSKPGGGEWTNVCNCDTIHSQFSNPSIAFYGGDLSHGELVTQASFSNLVSDGPCGSGGGFTVVEWIKENDPVCCDDPMGDLVAQFGLPAGAATQEAVVSAQNCNGGSQSGLPPFCGEFGATVRLTTQCETRADDSFGSCYGRCGEMLPDAKPATATSTARPTATAAGTTATPALPRATCRRWNAVSAASEAVAPGNETSRRPPVRDTDVGPPGHHSHLRSREDPP